MQLKLILQRLKCNNDIVITHSDKGDGIVILNRRVYQKYDNLSAMNKILEN